MVRQRFVPRILCGILCCLLLTGCGKVGDAGATQSLPTFSEATGTTAADTQPPASAAPASETTAPETVTTTEAATPETTVTPETTPEPTYLGQDLTAEEALSLCRAALEQVRAGNSLILFERFYDGDSSKNLSMEYDSAKNPGGPHVPWILNFQWQHVSYLEKTDKCILLRIDEAFDDPDSTQDHYFAAFSFQENGRLLSVELNFDPYTREGFWQSESILSLDIGT